MNDKRDMQARMMGMFEDINIGLLLHAVRNNLKWVVLFTLFTTGVAFLYLRYTPRVFQAVSTLMLKTQKTSQVLGVSELLRDDDTEIAREIQLLKSQLIVDRAVRSLPLHVSYYRKGRTRFLRSEIYSSTPFVVEVEVFDPIIFDLPLDIVLLDERNFELSYMIGSQSYKEQRALGERFETPFFRMKVQQTQGAVIEAGDLFVVKLNNHNTLVNEFARKLEVQPLIASAKTVKIMLNDPNKAKARDFVDAVTREFIEYDKERKAEGVRNIINFLNQQIDTFGSKFYSFQDTVKYFRLETGFVSPEQQIEGMVDKLDVLERKKNETLFDNNLLVWLGDYVTEGRDLNLLSLKDFNQNVGKATSHIETLNELQNERKILLLDVTQDHPRIRAIDEHVRDLSAQIAAELESATERGRYKLDLIDQEYQMHLGSLISLPDKETEFARLMRQSNLQEEFYLDLVEKRSQYLIAKAGIVSDYIIMQEAAVLAKPVFPNVMLIQTVGLLLGLIGGLLLVAFRYLFHQEIMSVGEIENNTDVAILGVVPRFKRNLNRSQIVVTQNPKSIMSEAFRSIRSNMQFIPVKSDKRIVSVTSTVSGEGKTFVVLNLAAILSLMDKKVVVVDFDMRKPRIAKIFDVESSKGISTILIDKSTVDECIHQSEVDNLDYITSGPVPPNPSELIMLPRCDKLFEELLERYDYVLIDTPPVGLVTDALDLMQKADYPIYVLRADYSKRHYVQNINRISQDNQIPHLSVVLNDFGRGASGGASSYGYGYGYSYGYGYGGSGYGYGYTQDGNGYYSDEEQPLRKSWWRRMLTKN